jgi:hypothetical protein
MYLQFLYHGAFIRAVASENEANASIFLRFLRKIGEFTRIHFTLKPYLAIIIFDSRKGVGAFSRNCTGRKEEIDL